MLHATFSVVVAPQASQAHRSLDPLSFAFGECWGEAGAVGFGSAAAVAAGVDLGPSGCQVASHAARGYLDRRAARGNEPWPEDSESSTTRRSQVRRCYRTAGTPSTPYVDVLSADPETREIRPRTPFTAPDRRSDRALCPAADISSLWPSISVYVALIANLKSLAEAPVKAYRGHSRSFDSRCLV